MNNIQTIHCHPLLHIAGLHVTSRWHVNGREQKHFSPLGTKRYFLMNSPRKILCFDPQHGRLVTWMQTKNTGNTEANRDDAECSIFRI